MPAPKIFDVHTHTQFAAFKDDQDTVIKRALDKGIWLVNVGSQRDTSAKAVEAARNYPEGVYACVGLHPIHTEKSYHDTQELDGDKGFTSRQEEFDYDFYKKLAINPKVVAIGECGLDYFHLESGTKEKQAEVFIKQVELSQEVKKPLMIHCRNAFDDLISVLKEQSRNLNVPAGIIHFFSGTKENAQELLNLGFYISFCGVITFARDYDGVIKYIPEDRILVESEAPYVSPAPYRGKRNEPVYIIETLKKMAEIRGVDFDKMVERTVENALKIFKIK